MTGKLTDPDAADQTGPASGFDLEAFLPYLLNQAAEATSKSFQAIYRADYGLTRTQWRVLANLGKFGSMTAHDICTRSHIEKTKVSRAVAALESIGHLSREISPHDRRAEVLSLTQTGAVVFADLGQRAITYDASLRETLGLTMAAGLDQVLHRLMSLGADSAPDEAD